ADLLAGRERASSMAVRDWATRRRVARPVAGRARIEDRHRRPLLVPRHDRKVYRGSLPRGGGREGVAAREPTTNVSSSFIGRVGSQISASPPQSIEVSIGRLCFARVGRSAEELVGASGDGAASRIGEASSDVGRAGLWGEATAAAWIFASARAF